MQSLPGESQAILNKCNPSNSHRSTLLNTSYVPSLLLKKLVNPKERAGEELGDTLLVNNCSS